MGSASRMSSPAKENIRMKSIEHDAFPHMNAMDGQRAASCSHAYMHVHVCLDAMGGSN